jgi:hypothetical protein
VSVTTSPPSVSQLPKQCGTINVTQMYRPPRSVTGVSFTYYYVDHVRTSQETHIWASTACYGHSFTFLYADDVRTSQETGRALLLYM